MSRIFGLIIVLFFVSSCLELETKKNTGFPPEKAPEFEPASPTPPTSSTPPVSPTPPPTGPKKPEGCVSSDDINTASIIGGRRVYPNDIDSKAALFIIAVAPNEDGKPQSQICTATPISDRVLITAAHCVQDATSVIAYFYADLTCESGFRAQTHGVNVQKYAIHPKYDHDSIFSSNPDVALILLEERIFNGYPIYPLFSKKVTSITDFNSDLYLYGYGVIKYESGQSKSKSSSGVLRNVVVDYSDLSIEEKSLKIANNGQRGVCSGDSGGSGLILVNGQYQILAINSYGQGGNNDPCSGTGSLILVEPYLNWFQTVQRSWGQ